MRRCTLRGTVNILKRLLVHVAAYNLGLVMRSLFGLGTPRGLQGRLRAAMSALLGRLCALLELWGRLCRPWALQSASRRELRRSLRLPAVA